MPKKPGFDSARKLIDKAKSRPAPSGGATTSSSVSNVSNSGQMSSSTQTTGATGAVTNTTVIRTQGDPGYSAGQESDVIKTWRSIMGL